MKPSRSILSLRLLYRQSTRRPETIYVGMDVLLEYEELVIMSSTYLPMNLGDDVLFHGMKVLFCEHLDDHEISWGLSPYLIAKGVK